MTKEQFEEAIKDKKSFTVLLNSGNLRDFSTSSINLSETFIEDTASWGQLTAYVDIKSVLPDKVIRYGTDVSFGSDPEMFILKDGKVVPSVFIIPEDDQAVTRDGFQVELHPGVNNCREVAGSNIARCLMQARDYARGIGAELSFGVGVRIDDETWKKSPISLRRFGCNPTENSYGDKKRRVTGMRERFRAGGGHIHVGLYPNLKGGDYNKMVMLMDIFAGNTMVILDQDESNIERRKNYGRAGEFRPKPYGLEYRVLSNFWLRHYTLWSMASGLVRNALGLMAAGLGDELISRFDMNKVREAINNNDKELAMYIFGVLCEFIKEKSLYSSSGLSFHNVDDVMGWLTSEDPLSKIKCHSTEQSMESWESKLMSRQAGFEKFIQQLS